MHIPDGFISGEINVTTYVASAVVIGIAVRRANRNIGDRQVPLLGMTAAFIFAAQMLNFPVAGGTSGHFVGAVLTAILLGPLNASIVMALVVTIQALVFADGGVTALGTNIFNMGIFALFCGYAIFLVLRLVLPSTKKYFLISSAVAAWCSVVVSSALVAVELALSGTSPLRIALPAMAGVHALIGIGEALITAVVLSVVLASRPDLVGAWKSAAVDSCTSEG